VEIRYGMRFEFPKAAAARIMEDSNSR